MILMIIASHFHSEKLIFVSFQIWWSVVAFLGFPFVWESSRISFWFQNIRKIVGTIVSHRVWKGTEILFSTIKPTML